MALLGNFDIALTESAGEHLDALAGVGVRRPEQLLGHELAEPAVDLANALDLRGAACEPAAVGPFLDGDMRPGLELQAAPFRVGAVVALQGALDIGRMGVVALDEVAVVALRRPDKAGEGRQQALRQASAEVRRARGQLEGQIRQRRPVSGAGAHKERLHQGGGLAPVVRAPVRGR